MRIAAHILASALILPVAVAQHCDGKVVLNPVEAENKSEYVDYYVSVKNLTDGPQAWAVRFTAAPQNTRYYRKTASGTAKSGSDVAPARIMFARSTNQDLRIEDFKPTLSCK